MTAVLMLLVGLLIIFLEFFLPGGLLAVIGAIVVISSVFFYISQDTSPIGVTLFIVAAGVSVGLAIKAALIVLRKSKPNTGWYSKGDQQGYSASEFNGNMIGRVGTVLSDLKPSGHIFIEGKRYQAISQSGYIDQGKEVKVIGGQGAYLIVKLQERIIS